MKDNIDNMNTIQTTGLHRNTKDKYYTKDTVAELCINYIKSYINIHTDDLIIEPSAGNGVFIKGIRSLSYNCQFYDIDPCSPEITPRDYLQYIHEATGEGKTHVIGNPPFGRQSSLAIKFIKKSCEFCDTISFILPKSFKKGSMQRAFPLQFHLIFETDLPEKSFLVDGQEYDVPCVFQIWSKSATNRDPAEKLEPAKFRFVNKHDCPDISFRRVGVNAGKIDTEIAEKSVQSHYFIQFTNNLPTEENRKRISQITYQSNNTVGPKSISKQELIKEFNQVL